MAERESEYNSPYTTASGPSSLSKQEKPVTGSSSARFVQQRSDVIHQGEVEEILQITSQEISQLTTSNAGTLVQLSNSSDSQEKLKELLPIYFYSWNLTTSHSIIVYLLLHYFLVKQEKQESVSAKQLYEEHIARLKSRMSDLEERLTKSSLALATASGNAGAAGRLQSQQNAVEVARLRRQIEQLQSDNDNLRRTNEEICRINEQWALDYSQLSDQISNATGFYSNSSTGTHSQETSRVHKSNSPSPVPGFGSSSSPVPTCSRCMEKESLLYNKESEITKLECGMESLKLEVRESEEKLRQKERLIERLEGDHQAIILQLQEIGDLQQAAKLKQEHRKLQIQFGQLKKQNQDTMCEKLHLQKQVEKLRQAFLNLFPFAQSQQQPEQPTNGGYRSFPMQTCRRHYQQYPHSDPPPTPPGLIARGDHHGSLVEKDKDHTPLFPGHWRQSEQVTGLEKPSKSLGPYDLLYPQQTGQKTSSTYSKPLSSLSKEQYLHPPLQTASVVMPQTGNTNSFSFSIPNIENVPESTVLPIESTSHPHTSTLSYPHTSTSSHPHTSISSHPHTSTSSHPHTSTSSQIGSRPSQQRAEGLHFSFSPSVSSGYNSPSLLQDNEHFSKSLDYNAMKDSSAKTSQTSFRSADSALGSSQKPRPKELFEIGNVGYHGNSLTCSNCKKQFKNSRTAFESWFEHVRYCEK